MTTCRTSSPYDTASVTLDAREQYLSSTSSVSCLPIIQSGLKLIEKYVADGLKHSVSWFYVTVHYTGRA